MNRRQTSPLKISDLDEVVQHLGPGSSLVLHTGYAEPQFLAAELARVGKRLERVTVYMSMPMGATPYAAADLKGHLVLRTFFPGKGFREAVNDGRAELIRAPLSTIPGMFSQRLFKADVLMLQVSSPDSDGRVSLGLSVDSMLAVLSQNPIVVAEMNPAMPYTCGDSCISLEQIDYVVDARTPPLYLPAAGPADEADQRIAEHVAGLIGHGAILQLGIGSIPDLVVARLGHLRDLGIHSGIITDAVRPLIERGVVTNATKRRFAGKTITTMAAGTPDFYSYLHQNPLIEFHPCSLTHDAALLAAIDGLCAINSVLQVDLAGQANAEQIDGRKISSLGGLPDFARGAAAAKGGRSIITLRSSSRGGTSSNILAKFPDGEPVSVPANDIDFVVTEYGVASIRGLGPLERARALIEVAHPNHRADLRRAT